MIELEDGDRRVLAANMSVPDEGYDPYPDPVWLFEIDDAEVRPVTL